MTFDMTEEKTTTRNRENKDFVMYYRKFLDQLTEMAGENYTAYKILQFICKNMDGTNALVVSMTTLSELMGRTRQTISKAVKYLEDNGWICVLKSGTSNVYIVNPDVAWTSYADDKKRCDFKANVILSATENAEFLKNPKATNHYKRVSDDFMKEVKKKKKDFDDQIEQIRKDA